MFLAHRSHIWSRWSLLFVEELRSLKCMLVVRVRESMELNSEGLHLLELLLFASVAQENQGAVSGSDRAKKVVEEDFA